MTLIVIAAVALVIVLHVTDDSEPRPRIRNYFDPTGGRPPLTKDRPHARNEAVPPLRGHAQRRAR